MLVSILHSGRGHGSAAFAHGEKHPLVPHLPADIAFALFGDTFSLSFGGWFECRQLISCFALRVLRMFVAVKPGLKVCHREWGSPTESPE